MDALRISIFSTAKHYRALPLAEISFANSAGAL
jgi:hypothetical protein